MTTSTPSTKIREPAIFTTWELVTLLLSGFVRMFWTPLLIVGYCAAFGFAIDAVMPAALSTSDSIVFHAPTR